MLILCKRNKLQLKCERTYVKHSRDINLGEGDLKVKQPNIKQLMDILRN